MENGNAFRVFTRQTLADLEGINLVDYYGEALPCALDDRIQTIIEKYRQASQSDRALFRQSLPSKQSSLFGIYGHRAATLAARQDAKAWLINGLIGYALANAIIPEKRKVEVGLAVYYHVAVRLGLKPVDVFEEVAQVAGAEMTRRLLVYGRRTDITLSKYGWLEQKTAEGVKYKFMYG